MKIYVVFALLCACLGETRVSAVESRPEDNRMSAKRVSVPNPIKDTDPITWTNFYDVWESLSKSNKQNFPLKDLVSVYSKNYDK